MSAAPARDARIALAPGMRLQWEAAQRAHVLLYPEGMVTLGDTAYEVLKRCDGRAVSEVVADLQQQYPQADLEADVLEFLEVARAEGWLRFQ